MKKLAALFIILALLLTQTSAFAEDEASPALPSSLKVLAIGNSFSVDAMQWLYNVLTDMGVEEVVLGNLYVSGCSLGTHASNAKNNSEAYTYYKCSKDTNGEWQKAKTTMLYGIEDEDWDYITMQQASGQSGLPSSYEPSLSYLIDYVKAKRPNAKLLWHMTWAYQGDSTHASFINYGKSQNVMYRSILNAVNQNIVNNSSFDGIIPCGTAVQNMRTSSIGDNMTRDGYHMNVVYGRYLLSVMWAKMLTGSSDFASLTGIPARIGTVDKDTLEIIIESVENAYKKPFEVTPS
ncbi:MAG: DUF4886 domain-containing protein [Clostridia bacterium]|nr:DUF4886 domain-containing protein [Clostridia bacterium]